MADSQVLWLAHGHLSHLTLFRDWDYFASHAASLHHYLWDHGTVPRWNFHLCAGEPELANPQSWAFTWPSLFTYVFTPNWALLTLWIALSVAGLATTFVLLRRWLGDPVAAFAGAVLYVCNGFFASHFNQGHVTFAFFHLIPVLVWAAERATDYELDPASGRKPFIAVVLVSALLFTGGLPHTVLYFYPAFLIYALCRFHSVLGARGWAQACRSHVRLLAAHLCGAAVASYKLLPVALWELRWPRFHPGTERVSVLDLLQSTISIWPDYFSTVRSFPRQYWGGWEYNAFVGWLPWFSALLCLGLALKAPRSHDASPRFPAIAYGCLLVLFGLLLALGNKHPLSPSSLFRYLPVLRGIRVFPRYQILTIFGLCILFSSSLSLLAGRGASWSCNRRALQIALMLIGLLPVTYQATLLVWNIRGVPDSYLDRLYQMKDRAAVPEIVIAYRAVGVANITHQRYLVDKGYWVLNCYEPLSLPYLKSVAFPEIPGSRYPLSEPPPSRLKELTATSVTLEYEGSQGSHVRLHIPWMLTEGFYVGGASGASDGDTWLPATEGGAPLTLHAAPPDDLYGFWLSGIALLGLGFGVLRRTSQRLRSRRHTITPKAGGT